MAAIQAMLNSQKTALDTTVNAARDDVKADNVAQIAAARSPIKSLQRGSAISTIAASQDIAISAVNMAKSVVIVNVGLEVATLGNSAENYKASAELVSGTLLRLRHPAAGGPAAYGRINWQVVEYF